MLHELHVRDLALIREAWLEFEPGMTVLTGETGAGKTALLGALKLLLGERADSQSVRANASEALVEGVFSAHGSDLIAKRRVGADGRSRCQLSGEAATVGLLGEVLGPLVDLHGQHEHQALLSSSSHVGYLDRWLGETAGDLLSAYRTDLAAYVAAVGAEAELEARIADARRDQDYLSFVLGEIERVSPLPQEDEEIEARLPALQHSEKLAEAATLAGSILRNDGGVVDELARAVAALERVQGIDANLDEIARSVRDAQIAADEMGSALRHYRDGVQHDPKALDDALARLAQLNGLKKKYGPSLDHVLAERDRMSAALVSADHSEEARQQAATVTRECASRLEASGKRLDEARRAGASGFVSALAAACADLEMSGSSFEVSFADIPFQSWGPEGPAHVEFLYSPAPGQPARPLTRIASGGEVSRVMLALKGVLGSADAVETLVFDEVDAGIGGTTAHAVGKRLADLAASHQVLVVTHLAQVAAYANEHMVVRKETRDGETFTTVVKVEGDSRVAEIARMLSGDTSDVSLAHARELLDAQV